MDQWTAMDHPEGFDGMPREAPVRLLKRSVLRGCNVHDRHTVVVQPVDLGILGGRSSGLAGADFASAFIKRFRPMRQLVPGSDLAESLLCDLGKPAGAPFEAVLLEAILAVETAIAFELGYLAPIAFSDVQPGSAPGEIRLIWSCHRTRISRHAAAIGLLGLLALLPTEFYPHRHDDSEPFETAFDDLRAYARKRRMAPTTAALVLAAKRRGIPCEALGGPRLRIGQGVNQRHVFASVTAGTSFWACRLSGDKRHTNRRLAQLGLPVPRQIKVADVDDAKRAARELGFPLAIKPLKGKKGGAVTAGIRDPAHLADAFAVAEKAGSGVIVEQFIEGDDHRLLVIGGRFIAATKRTPPKVEGDGVKTIRQLIDDLNADPDRDGFRMVKVGIDEILEGFLAKNGHRFDDIPDKGETVVLRSTANGSTGGVFTDVTAEVHPDNQALAIQAANAVELDVAGVDFMTTDIGRSYKTDGGAIIEINSRPGLRPHTWPSYGKPRDVAGVMLDHTLPEGSDGRIPTLLIAGDRGTGPAARDVDALLRGTGGSTGLVTREASFLNGQPTHFDEKEQRRAAAILMREPTLEALISTISLRQTVKRGLGFDRCHVAAVMNRVIEGHVDLFRDGLGIIAKAADKLVVGAGNAVALEALRDVAVNRLILVSPRLRDRVVERHLSAGGAAVVTLWNAGRDRIVLYDNDEVITAIAIDPSVTRRGKRAQTREIEARMFAVAIAYGAGMTGPDIEKAIQNAPKQASKPNGRTVAAGAVMVAG